MSCNCDCKESSSSFVFGLLLGIILGAIIALVIYKKNKGKILDELQKKLTIFFENLSEDKPLKKKSVILPSKIIESTITTTAPKVKTKTFVKSKKA